MIQTELFGIQTMKKAMDELKREFIICHMKLIVFLTKQNGNQ